MWETREKSIEALNSILKSESSMILDGLQIIDELILLFCNIKQSTAFARVCCLILMKGNNLIHGILSLSLEGLAQEAGALLRPTVECIELLQYLREDPQRTEKITEGKKPSAGEIAKLIKGDFQDLRRFLNTHSSHLTFSYESMQHLIDWNDGSLKTKQNYSEKVLRTNLSILFNFLVFLSFEAANCLDETGFLPDHIINKINDWKIRGISIAKSSLESYIDK